MKNDEFETGYNPNDEFVDGLDVECDEDLSIDYHEELGDIGQIEEMRPSFERKESFDRAPVKPPNKRQAKIKIMSPKLKRAFPGVASILITRHDGRQVLFVGGK